MNKKLMAFGLMSVLLLVLAFSQANAQPRKQPGPMGPGLGPGYQLLKDALQLTPEQEKKLEEFRKARQEEARAFQEKMRSMREEFRKLMQDPKADRKKLDSLIDEMAKMKAERMKSALKNREEWRKIFTPEQLKKLDEYRQDMALRTWMQRRAGWKMMKNMRPGRGFGPGCWR
jgi:Spy/CpxP family protein refolding chaperone